VGKVIPVKDRFLSKVNKTSDCWNWTGYIGSNRYGQLKINHKMIKSHRVSYELYNGDIPAGLNVLHKCDNTKCVNPDHLFLGSQKENVQDMLTKNRANRAFGSKAGRSRLLQEQVLDIRQQYKVNFISWADLGRRFGVTGNAVRMICLNKVWRHI
jgi:hypothetical protein